MSDYRLGKLKGRWVAVFYENGRRHRWRLNAANASEARAALREFSRERESLRRPQERLTVVDVWDDYLAEIVATGKASANRIRDAWKRLGDTFGRIRPDDLSMAMVRGYIQHRRCSASDGTIHTELGYLRAALRHGVRQGLLSAAPNIVLPSKPRPKSRHLTPEEARKLLDAASMPHVRLFILLALYTAGRPSSILDLVWSRVDMEAMRICLDNPSRDRTAKGRATVPLAPALVQHLIQARSAALTEHVIEWAGQPLRSIKKGIGRTAERAGLKGVTPYVLRHTAAVWMAEAGVPMEEIAQFMGHTSPAVTFRTYARYSPDYLRKAGNAISTALYGCAEPMVANGNGTKGGQRANEIKEE
jgi:integrase